MQTTLSGTEQAYTTWLNDHGFELSGCAIGVAYPSASSDAPSATGVRGVVATEPLADRHVLFRVPGAAVLSAASSTFAPAIAEASLPAGAALAVALALENADKDSPWRPYLDILPEVLDTPLFWSERECKLLGGTRVLERANVVEVERVFKSQVLPLLKRIARSDFAKEKGVILDHSALSLRTFMRFGSIALAYSFTVNYGDGGGDIGVMLPFADMLNATPTGVNSQMCYGDDGSFEMITTEPVGCGCELINSYGARANAELLTRYGYVARQNPADGIALTLSELCEAAAATQPDCVDPLVRAHLVVKKLRKLGRMDPLPRKQSGPFAIQETVFEVRLRKRGVGGFGEVVCPLVWRLFSPDAILHIAEKRLRELADADKFEAKEFPGCLSGAEAVTHGGFLAKKRERSSLYGMDLSPHRVLVKRRVEMAQKVRCFSRAMLTRIANIALSRKKP